MYLPLKEKISTLKKEENAGKFQGSLRKSAEEKNSGLCRTYHTKGSVLLTGNRKMIITIKSRRVFSNSRWSFDSGGKSFTYLFCNIFRKTVVWQTG